MFSRTHSFRRGIVALLFTVVLVGLSLSGCNSVQLTHSSLFTEYPAVFEKLKPFLSAKEGQLTAVLGEQPLAAAHSPQNLAASYGNWKWDAKLRTCLVQNILGYTDDWYYLVGADYLLPDGGAQTHWLVIPEDMNAAFEFAGDALMQVYPEVSASSISVPEYVYRLNLLEGPAAVDEGDSIFAQMEASVAKWSPDQTTWSDGYIMDRTDQAETVRDLIIYQLRKWGFADYADPMILRESTDRNGKNYFLVGVNYELDDFSTEPHWFIVPEELRAVYEYDPLSKEIKPFGSPFYNQDYDSGSPESQEDAPGINLTSVQLVELSALLDEVADKESFYPMRIKMRMLLSSATPDLGHEIKYFKDGHFLPKESLTKSSGEIVYANDGTAFTLSTACYLEGTKKAQRWFLLSNKDYGAVYDIFPGSISWIPSSSMMQSGPVILSGKRLAWEMRQSFPYSVFL